MAINLKDYNPALMQGANLDVSLSDVVIDDLTVGDDASVGGDLAVTGTLAVTSTSVFTGAVDVDSTTDSTSGTTGALKVAGGVGIEKALYVGTTSTLIGAVNYKRQVTDTGGAFATPIVLTAAQSGRVLLLDDAAGLDFTLPALDTAAIGTHFKFLLIVEPTSNSYRITAASGDVLSGHVVIFDKDVVEGSTEALLQVNQANGSSHLVITITGSDDTQGSLIGGWLELTAISATGWFVQGSLVGDGALATIFS
jgi:hypothetical protein